jgi:uracil-DNA glycosylase
LSAYRGFIGCGHFSKANRYLEEKERGAVEWGKFPK